MKGLIGAAVGVVGLILLELLGQVLGEAIAFALSPLRILYRPPHGRVVLGATWLLALAGTFLASRALESELGAIAFMSCLPVALVGSFVYRDEVRRVAQDEYLPPAPRRVLGG